MLRSEVESLLGLAYHLAAEFARRGGLNRHDREDLRQTACLALLRAARGFDPQKGRLKAYASRWVRGELKSWWQARRSAEVPTERMDLFEEREIEDTSAVEAILCRIGPTQAAVLRRMFRMGVGEIARELGVSRQMVYKSRLKGLAAAQAIAASIQP